MGKKKSSRSFYKPLPEEIAPDVQLQGKHGPAKFDKYIGRRVYILELEDGAIDFILRTKALHRFGRINRLENERGSSMTVFFATQSSAASCVRELDVSGRVGRQDFPRVLAFCMDWVSWCYNRSACKLFDCTSDHDPGAEGIDDFKDVRFRGRMPHGRRQLLLQQHHSHMTASPSASFAAKTTTMEEDSGHRSTQSKELRQLQVQGSIDGVAVTAVPDFGSGFDIMSAEVAELHGFAIDHKRAHSYTLPTGKVKQFLGTVTAQWCFDKESTPYTRTFHVLQGCVHPVLLGKEFLRLTETFSRHVRRIKVAIVAGIASIRRLLLVDHFKSITQTNERMLGLINGRPVPGFADTCSDISIIKRSVAKTLGLEILEGPSHRVEVEFVDGSRAFTTGSVKNVQWCFSASLSPKDMRAVDFHIMDDIPCAVILDKWLLWDNRAFIDYGDCFFDVGVQKTAELDPVCLIQVKRSKKIAAAIDPVEAEVARRVAEDDRIDELPPGQRVYARATETRRRLEWEQNRVRLQGSALASTGRPDPLASPFVPAPSVVPNSGSSPRPALGRASSPLRHSPVQPSTASKASTPQATAAVSCASSSSCPSSTSPNAAITKPTSDDKGWTTVFRRKKGKK